MPDDMSRAERQDAGLTPAAGFAFGLTSGLLLGLFTDFMPVIAIVIIGLLIPSAVLGVRARADASRSFALAAALIGSGAVLLFFAVSTVASCIDTEDFCGNANPWPLAVFAAVCLGIGVAATLAIVVQARRSAT
jgi:hypothetical protein